MMKKSNNNFIKNAALFAGSYAVTKALATAASVAMASPEAKQRGDEAFNHVINGRKREFIARTTMTRDERLARFDEWPSTVKENERKNELTLG